MNQMLGHSNSYHGFTLEEALRGIAAAGFRYVEINAVKGWTEHLNADLTDAELADLQKLLDSLGLTAVALSGHCNLMDKTRLNDFGRNIELAARLGCQYIVSSVGEAHFGEDETRDDAALIANIRSLLPALEAKGLTLAIETHGEDFGTGASLLPIVQGIGSPLVGINFDTANSAFWGGACPLEDIKTCAEYVKFVHIKDKDGAPKEWNFPGLGNGKLPLREVVAYLTAQGYTGPYSVEVEYTEAFSNRTENKPGDLDIANREMADSFKFLSAALGR